jgi:hypothetical protein
MQTRKLFTAKVLVAAHAKKIMKTEQNRKLAHRDMEQRKQIKKKDFFSMAVAQRGQSLVLVMIHVSVLSSSSSSATRSRCANTLAAQASIVVDCSYLLLRPIDDDRCRNERSSGKRECERSRVVRTSDVARRGPVARLGAAHASRRRTARTCDLSHIFDSDSYACSQRFTNQKST